MINQLKKQQIKTIILKAINLPTRSLLKICNYIHIPEGSCTYQSKVEPFSNEGSSKSKGAHRL